MVRHGGVALGEQQARGRVERTQERGQLVEAPDEKMRALEAFTERLMPGRWYDAREPNAQELKATGVVRMPIEQPLRK